MNKIGIGSTVWVFDGNCRTYRRDADGRAIGGPIRRESWVPVKIVGENRASWILSRYGKFLKTPKDGRRETHRDAYGSHRVAISQQEVDDDCWIHDHRQELVRQIQYCSDAAILRQVAALVGYQETPK